MKSQTSWKDKIGKKRLYNKSFSLVDQVILWETIEVKNGEKINLHFISTQSVSKQGIFFYSDRGLDVEKKHYSSLTIWKDTAPDNIQITVLSTNNLLTFYNVWDKGKGQESQSQSSGMLVEERNGILFYRCNDIGFKTNFDKLVFSIERL